MERPGRADIAACQENLYVNQTYAAGPYGRAGGAPMPHPLTFAQVSWRDVAALNIAYEVLLIPLFLLLRDSDLGLGPLEGVPGLHLGQGPRAGPPRLPVRVRRPGLLHRLRPDLVRSQLQTPFSLSFSPRLPLSWRCASADPLAIWYYYAWYYTPIPENL